ncbi:MAG TPA: hypothetical protein VIP79_04080, partial [Gemmatimonadaceae bacterium]
MTRHTASRTALLACVLSLASIARAQQPEPAMRTDSARAGAALARRIQAVHLERAAVKVDGKLDDAAWRSAKWVSDFVQREPSEGAPPTERTEVAFLYDDDALYVGARMFSDSREKVRALVTRRDRENT